MNFLKKIFLAVFVTLLHNSLIGQVFDENIVINNYDGNPGSGKALIFGHSQDGSNTALAEIRSSLKNGSGPGRAGHLIFQTTYNGQGYDRMTLYDNGNLALRNVNGNPGSGTALIFGHSQNGSNTALAEIRSSLKDGSGPGRAGHLVFRTTYNGQGYDRMTLHDNGNVSIGASSADAKLTVKGNIHTQEVKVDLAGAVAPDYVFKENYELRTLDEIEEFVLENHHLPEIPTALEMEERGLNLKEMNLKLLKKIEELTLYLIEQNKQNRIQQNEIEALKAKISEFEPVIDPNNK